MAIFGALAKVGQGVARNHQLDKLIDRYKEIDRSSVLDHYVGEKRFVYANELANIYCNAKPQEIDRKIECLNSLYKEFQVMTKTEELDEPVKKSQLYAVALAIKELSVGLENDKDEIEQRFNILRTNHDLEIRNSMNRFDSKLNKLEVDLKKDLLKKIEEIEKKISVHEDKMCNEMVTIKKIIEDQHRKMIKLGIGLSILFMILVMIFKLS